MNEGGHPQPQPSTVLAILQGVTGIAASEGADKTKAIGRALQAAVAGNFAAQVSREWHAFRQEGRIPESFADSPSATESASELFGYINSESPDSIIFEALKKIFFVGAINPTEQTLVLGRLYSKLVRQLSPTALLVLMASFRVTTSSATSGSTEASRYRKLVAEKTGLHQVAIVELEEESLEGLKLWVPRLHTDRSGLQLEQYGRLTDTGYALCDFISKYTPPNGATASA